ncbi:MAG TPA: HAMP domain-containing sensor histidine kinase [Candidatus Acidoferrales bacterium]|nr:HAMP domain-containing sensor histidine kinase [Candidatus Acidoferrales bacterium]
MNKSASAEVQTPGATLFGLMSSLLDALDKPLLVTDRSGRVLFANLHAQNSVQWDVVENGAQPNLFRDVLHVDARGLFGQLEGGEQEVNLQIQCGGAPARARIRWLPEPDWLVIFAEPAPNEAPADQDQMRQTVHDLLQEREITYRNLLAAYLRLQEVNRQKTVFLGSAAHELKTPLAVMKGYYDLLLSGSLGNLSEKQRDILQESKHSCDRLVRLVSTFLNYTALESGKLVLQFQDNDIRDCVNDMAVRWKEAFRRANVNLEVILDEKLPAFKFDYPKIQQCVTNLVDNALKHTPAGGKVTLQVQTQFWERRISPITPTKERRAGKRPQPNSVLVSVTDTGVGIAAEFHQEIFEDFVRVDPSSSGMGLGLAITKRLIQAHHGKIWVDSEPGRGSSFKFLLPMKVEVYSYA